MTYSSLEPPVQMTYVRRCGRRSEPARVVGPRATEPTSTHQPRESVPSLPIQAVTAFGVNDYQPQLSLMMTYRGVLAAFHVIGIGWFGAVAAEAGPGKRVAVVTAVREGIDLDRISHAGFRHVYHGGSS